MMGLRNLFLVGGLCLMLWSLTSLGLKDLSLIGGLYLVQLTLTTNGVRNLPLFGSICLARQTLAIMASNDTQQALMTNDAFINN